MAGKKEKLELEDLILFNPDEYDDEGWGDDFLDMAYVFDERITQFSYSQLWSKFISPKLHDVLAKLYQESPHRFERFLLIMLGENNLQAGSFEEIWKKGLDSQLKAHLKPLYKRLGQNFYQYIAKFDNLATDFIFSEEPPQEKEIPINIYPIYQGESEIHPSIEEVEMEDSESELPENSFFRCGERWSIFFQGKARYVTHVRGLEQIALLLNNPNEDIPASLVFHAAGTRLKIQPNAPMNERGQELLMAAEIEDASPGSLYNETRTVPYFPEKLSWIEDDIETENPEDVKYYQRLRREIKKYQSKPLSPKQKKELEVFQKELNRLSNAKKRYRNVSKAIEKTGSPLEQARVNVSRTIRDAISKIEKVHPELAAHLKASIQTGTYCRYLPKEDILWTV